MRECAKLTNILALMLSIINNENSKLVLYCGMVSIKKECVNKTLLILIIKTKDKEKCEVYNNNTALYLKAIASYLFFLKIVCHNLAYNCTHKITLHTHTNTHAPTHTLALNMRECMGCCVCLWVVIHQ